MANLYKEQAQSILNGLSLPATRTHVEQLAHLLRAFAIYVERNERYNDVWQVTGWRGAVYDIYKKATRLFQQYWRKGPSDPKAQTDDAYDLINFAVFFLRGVEDDNEFGRAQ